MSRPQRAAPMTADDRRAAILSATVPLLRSQGMNVTTRELAEAAGVAEGTLFRVFPDKEALVRAAIAHALDPAPLIAELDAIPSDADIRTAVGRAVELMVARSRDVVALLSASYEAKARFHSMHHPGGPGAHGDPGGPGGADDSGGPRSGFHGMGPGDGRHPMELLVEAITALLTRHGGDETLRREPAVCARMLVVTVLAGSRPMGHLNPLPPLSPDDIVELFLDGAILAQPAPLVPVLSGLLSISEEPC